MENFSLVFFIALFTLPLGKYLIITNEKVMYFDGKNYCLMEKNTMEIKEIENKHIKIGKTSITVINTETGKTCGVVRNIRKFTDLQPNRQINYFGKLRNAGVWRSRIDGIIDCVIISDNQLYYLHNLAPINFYNKYLADHEGFEDEKTRFEERQQIAENMKKIATVIPCYIY